ncbi:hypothetical protein DAKH74_056600 [Maudiozyma humilis]|uniref:Uncharacterized protein n=1 Tax=Maudiozyma humilis TaxID=51915 RepID=A0AAV5S5N5_MAUHU|nr:hypothetical protein DAKH74_056600 [Kazachstania humilis]
MPAINYMTVPTFTNTSESITALAPFELATLAYLNNATDIVMPLDPTALQLSLKNMSAKATPSLTLWGARAEAVDFSRVSFMTIMNLVAITGTFYSCGTAPIQPIPAWSCIFNGLAFATSLLLNILVGIDIVLPPAAAARADAPQRLFRELGAQSTSKLPEFGERLFEHHATRLEDLGRFFVYEYEAAEGGQRCVSLDLSRLSFGVLPAAKHRVCLTEAGIAALTKKHRVGAPLSKVAKTLRKHKVGSAESSALSQLYGQYGGAGSQLMEAMSELHEKYSQHVLLDLHGEDGITVDVRHHHKLLVHIALDLL